MGNMVDSPPEQELPAYVVKFLAAIMGLPEQDVMACWLVFKDIIWHTPKPIFSPQEISDILEFGSHPNISKCIGMLDSLISCGWQKLISLAGHIMLYPRTRHCLKCKGRLVDPRRYKTVLFSSKEGAQAAYTTSTACKSKSLQQYYISPMHKSLTHTCFCSECNLRYHHNFVVDAKQDCRTWYHGTPDIIEVDEHAFMTSDLCDLHLAMMSSAWSVLNFDLLL